VEMAGSEQDEMACRELVQLVTDYFEHALAPQDRARLEAHLAECPCCEAYIAQMRRTVEALGRLPRAPIDPARERELLEAFRGGRSRNASGARATKPT
jgi:anti-sigma factor RsiW